MTIIVPKDAGPLLLGWQTVATDKKRFKTEHLTMQQQGPGGLFFDGLMKKTNKKYRILLLKTEEFLKFSEKTSSNNDNSAVNDSLIGKKWIVAEDDNWKEIIISWYKLEQYLLPMLELKRKYYVNEITDLLLSISDKRVKLMNSKQKATNDHNMKNNEHAFEDIGEPYDSRSKHNQQDDIIYDIEDVKDCLEEFQQAIVLVRSILKKAESDTKNRDKLLQELKKVQLENLKQLSAKLEKFIKTKDSTKDVVRQRLLSQFKELNEIYQTQILKNELLKKPIAQQSNKMTAVSHNPKPSTKMVNKGTDTSSDDESGNGELQLQVKQKLTSAQKSTLNVERAIAIETNQKISEIQSEMLQVNEIFRDLNQLLEEQDLLIDVIANNVESANENTKQGNKDLKEAKNLHNFKFY